MQVMRVEWLAVLVGLLLLSATVVGAAGAADDPQSSKEQELVETLKKLMTCQDMRPLLGPSTKGGDLSCSLSFRGLQLEFAGVNTRGGGTIYVTALGKNQTLSSLGSRCLRVVFDDPDLTGLMGAQIIFRNDGVISPNEGNPQARADCR